MSSNEIVELHRKRKRVFDIAFSLAFLFGAIPLIIVIVILIKFQDPRGPIFFIQKRVGRQGKVFKCIKFRTMVVGAEEILKKLLAQNPEMQKEYEIYAKLKNDPRIIPGIGKFLRKSSLDEIPQFINVLFGDMSVVGPRPILPSEIEKYGENYAKLTKMKPGITGLWQVSGRNTVTFGHRVEFDAVYLNCFGIRQDLNIIKRTLGVFFRSDDTF